MKKSQTKAKPVAFFSQPRNRKALLLASLGTVIFLAIVTSALAIYTSQYKQKIYPRTFIGTQDFGGKTVQEATEMVNTASSQTADTITIQITDPVAETKLAKKDIGLTYNTAQTVETLYKVGRTGSLWTDVQQLLASIFSKNERFASYSLAEAKVHEKLPEVAQNVGTPAEDAKLVLSDTNTLSISPAKEGRGITTAQLENQLRQHLGQFATTVTLAAEKLSPKVTEAQAAYAQSQVQEMLGRTPITFVADGAKTTADAKKVFSWITYELGQAPITPTPQTSLTPTPLSFIIPSAKAQASTVLLAKLDPERVKDYVANFAITVNRDPQDAELDVTNGKINVTKEHTDGKKMKLDQAAEEVIKKLTDPTTVANSEVTLPVETVEAKIKATTIESLGIKELIGHAQTTFKGSPANRIHNINTGAKFLDGAIVAPGEEFSTVSTLGAVDGSTGYLPELVIKENRTTPEFGGGLCQVSTTLFRSVMNAGLKVTERQNHSYRVSYYEPPVGLDATIYLPRPDFKFLNDTPGYILIQAKVEGTKITFDLYGTKDGRTSTVSDPIVSDITDPPADIYTDTDTLPKGEIKQIEKPHQGATAVVTYTVMRDGKEINKQVFRSKYKAWAARFLVGTRE